MPPYTTPAECKALSALAVVQAKTDPQLVALIARAEFMVNAWTNNRFDLQSGVTKRVTGSGSQMLILPERLDVLTSVKFLDLDDGGAIILSEEEVKDIFNRNWYLIAEQNFGAPRTRRFLGKFPSDEDAVEILGDWGYTIVPGEVKNATCLIVEKTVASEKNAEAIAGSFKSERIGDYKYELQDTGEQTPKEQVANLIPVEARLLLRKFHKPIRPRAI